MPVQAQEGGSGVQVLDPEILVDFRLEGAPELIRGRLRSWDSHGIVGSFGTHAWEELDLRSLNQVCFELIDARVAADLVFLGELQLRRVDPEADHRAEQTFRRALALDPASRPLIEAARERAAAFERAQAEAERLRAAQRLQESMPEGKAWAASPWPVQTDAEQAQAVLDLREETAALLSDAGLPETEPIETDYFLVYLVNAPGDPRGVIRDLDQIYRKIATLLDLPEVQGRPINLFWGKAVVIIAGEEGQFRLIEAHGFNQKVPAGVVGLCHSIGPKVFVNTYRTPDDFLFASVLVHEAVHGMMHRFVTPKRLPTWANEGLADWAADNIVPGRTLDAARRRQGLDFIRGGGRLEAIMEMNYEDGSWPGPDGVGYGASYLLVHYMIDQNRYGFADWVREVKAGGDWREAMVSEYGASADRLVRFAREWHLTND